MACAVPPELTDSLERLLQERRSKRYARHKAKAMTQLEELCVEMLLTRREHRMRDAAMMSRLGHIQDYVMSGDMPSDVPDPHDCDILIVDDDDALREEVTRYLADHGFTVHQARDAKETRQKLQSAPIQVMVLDAARAAGARAGPGAPP